MNVYCTGIQYADRSAELQAPLADPLVHVRAHALVYAATMRSNIASGLRPARQTSMLRVAVGLIGTLLVASGCSVSQSTAAGEAAVSHFHVLLDAGDFDEIYASSSEELKAATSQQDFTALLDAVHRKLGKTGSSTKQGWNVNYHTSGTFVTLSYKTSYAQGEAVENFVYRMKADVPALVTYNVNSNVLILR